MPFEKFNANPDGVHIKDCSIRAICTATPLTYEQVKKMLETKVFETGVAWNTVTNIRAVLADLGIELKKATQRENVNTFCKKYAGDENFIVIVAHHAIAIVGGVVLDTWDSTRTFVKYVAKVSREKFAELKAKYNPDKEKEEEKKMDWTKIFAACETIEELKKAFKKACMSCHPDKGGTAAEFKAMQEAHDKRAAELAQSEGAQQWARNKKSDGTYKTAEEILAEQQEFAEIFAKLMPLNGLEIEICGSWLWIGGNTKENKEALKGAGCKWANKKKLWYWHAGEWVKKIRKTLSMDEIRDLHGSERVSYQQNLFALNA